MAAMALRRHISMVGDTGDNKSGHITTTRQEGILFFNSILPPNLTWFFRLWTRAGKKTPKLADTNSSGAHGVVNPAEVFQKATQHAQLGEAEVVEVLPRFGEGGAFLKFRHDHSHDSRSIGDAVRQYLRTHKSRPWWNPFTHVRAHLVLGKPWVEDLSRNPSRRLKVEFLPTEPGAEAAGMFTRRGIELVYLPPGHACFDLSLWTREEINADTAQNLAKSNCTASFDRLASFQI